MRPVAHIYTDFPEKFGVPRQSGRVCGLVGRVVFEKDYAMPEALRGIEGFSHLWLLWGFSLTRAEGWSPTVRPPRLGGNKRVGVFASRSPNRPNPIGLSAVRLLAVSREKGELSLLVEGADIVNGTPIYDIKPYLAAADSIPDAVDGFAAEHVDHKLTVDCPQDLLEKLPEDKREALLGVLSDDTRPGYKHGEERYGLSFAGFSVAFYVDADEVLHVTDIEKERKK